jgi:Uma2 family endonuclease
MATRKANPIDQPTTESDYVVFYGVPWDTYEGILDALGEYHLRHTYDEGALEMRRLVYGVTLEDYVKLLDATPDFSLPHSYDEGTLEMMSPRKDHDWVAKLIGRMIEAMTLALNIPIQSTGSTTLRAAKGASGLQPDQTYYVANELHVRGKDTYDPKKDPPPDLAIEIDVTSSSVPRMPLFARIGVPEVWRYRDERVEFFRLGAGGDYERVDRSVAFPFITAVDLAGFVRRRQGMDENSIIKEFVEWAKTVRTLSENRDLPE